MAPKLMQNANKQTTTSVKMLCYLGVEQILKDFVLWKKLDSNKIKEKFVKTVCVNTLHRVS